MGKSPTIYDVVRESGLSKGTVYRVVYGKGSVSESSRRKVLDAVERLHYSPNVFATSLAVRKRRTVVCITPEFSEGSYWEGIHRGFEAAACSVRDLGLSLEYLYYCESDSESFKRALDMSLELRPDGMVLGLQFESMAIEFVRELKRRAIPYVLIDNLFEDNGRLAYFGVDFFQSGRLAAHLLSGGESIDSYLLVRLRRDNAGFSDPTKRRREGFIKYLEEHCPACTCHMLTVVDSDPSGSEKALDDFFRDYPSVRHAAVMNSRAYLLSDYLASHSVPGIKVVGFDDIPRNLQALGDGRLSFLLTHHLDIQASACIKALASYLLRGECPAHRDNYMHLDILTGLNLDNY